jgi:hypothetical protein
VTTKVQHHSEDILPPGEIASFRDFVPLNQHLVMMTAAAIHGYEFSTSN